MNATAIRAWFEGLETRERGVLIGGAIALALIVLVGGLLMPLNSATRRAVARSAHRRDDLVWMRAHAAAIRAGAANVRAPIDEPPIVLIDRSARDAGLSGALRGTQPAGANGVRVQFAGAPFDAMVIWLATLDRRYGFTVESITVDRGTHTGTVDANVTLAPPPG